MNAASHPIVWSIAGSDSGGGAGIQADLKVMTLLGAHACSVVTALTAQNTQGTTALEWVSPDMLRAQLSALDSDLPPNAIKLGMLGTTQTVEILAEFLPTRPDTFSVCDPVLIASSGTPLLEPAAWPILIERLLPAVTLITPNLPEAEQLLGCRICTPNEIQNAAQKLLDLGVREVLIKGGHSAQNRSHACDYWSDGQTSAWLSSPRLTTRHSHGTGCVLSSAIAAARALDHQPLESIVLAKSFLNQALRQAPKLGRGCGPLAFRPWANAQRDRPTISKEIGAEAAMRPSEFNSTR